MQIGATIVGDGQEFPQKMKNRNSIGSSNSTTGYLPQGSKNTSSERYTFTVTLDYH